LKKRTKKLVLFWGVMRAGWVLVTFAAFTLLNGFICAVDAATETVLHSFSGADGAFPFAGLIADDAGNLYGTAWGGGNAGTQCDALGCGLVFKIGPGNAFTALHAFGGGADGGNPAAPLLRDPAGNLYGTTARGGPKGYGTFFRIDASGHETILHSFLGGHDDGIDPAGPIVSDHAGNLFGTTNSGGAADAGIIFELSPNKANGTMMEHVLHDFGSLHDGAHPGPGGLSADNADNFFGTTAAGGAAGKGTIFKMSLHGPETVLHSFTGSDGALPLSGLLFDGYGSFYGTTFRPATIFKLAPRGTVTISYRWRALADGTFPQSALIFDPKESLIGTTSAGGTSNGGTVFKLSPVRKAEASYTAIYSFASGSQPIAGILRDKAGDLYGTTLTGGPSHKGTVFMIKP
jgi:uncharacterized repeat protein (TIGR03803 family)